MVNGIHGLTVERGIDPAGYPLSDCGGALGVHVARIGRELGVDSIVLPKQAGIVSALGRTISQLRHNFTASHRTASNCFDTDRVNDTFVTLEQRGEASSSESASQLPSASIAIALNRGTKSRSGNSSSNFPIVGWTMMTWPTWWNDSTRLTRRHTAPDA